MSLSKMMDESTEQTAHDPQLDVVWVNGWWTSVCMGEGPMTRYYV